MSRLSRTDTGALRRQVETLRRALDESEAKVGRLRTALDAVDVGVVIVDMDGRTLVRNAAASLGGHADLLVADVVRRLVIVAKAAGHVEERVELFGPPLRVLSVGVAPLDHEQAVVTIEDLSERARLDAVRTDFVSNISHELKTPVGALAVLAETIEDSDDPDVHRRLAARMVEEAHRAGRTIDDLLDLSRIELGGQGERGLVPVADIFHDVVERHRLTAERVDIDLQVDHSTEEVIDGDRLQLVSAVSNLVDDAVKYSNPGGTVRLSARRVPDAVEIDVADQGVGIPQRDLDRIFERFYRVDRGRSRDTGGTGLGLAIVRHVATNHGGTVTVRSHEGAGSTFTLRIPMRGQR